MLNYDVSCFNRNLKSENIFWTIIKVWRNKFISNISHVLTRIFLWIFYVDLARDDNYWIASPSRGNIKNQFDCFKITMQVVRIFPYWTLKILFQFGSVFVNNFCHVHNNNFNSNFSGEQSWVSSGTNQCDWQCCWQSS